MTNVPLGGGRGTEERYLSVGIVRKPHGIKGELVVELETDNPEAVFRRGRVLRVGDAEGQPGAGVLTVEHARPFKGGILLRTREHPTRTQATDGLRGRSLLIPEAEVAPLAEGEIFYHQLIGLRVRAPEGEVGTIREIREVAAADLLVVQRPDGREALIPWVKEIVRRIDPQAGVVEIEPPEGLLEL